MIGADCDIRESVTMNIGTEDGGGVTEVGERGFFMAYSHVGHDCQVGNDVVFANSATLGGHCVIGDHAFIGGLSAVHQFPHVGAHAMIGGLTGLRADVIPFGLASGAFARLSGMNMIGMRRRKFAAETIRAVRRPIGCCSSSKGVRERSASPPSKRSSAATRRYRRSSGSFVSARTVRCAGLADGTRLILDDGIA